MKKKIVNFSESVYEITKKDPEIINILVELGFDNISNPAIRNTMGKFMTIPKGSAMKKKDINEIIKYFEVNNYEVIYEKE